MVIKVCVHVFYCMLDTQCPHTSLPIGERIVRPELRVQCFLAISRTCFTVCWAPQATTHGGAVSLKLASNPSKRLLGDGRNWRMGAYSRAVIQDLKKYLF